MKDYIWHRYQNKAYFISEQYCCQINAKVLFGFGLWIRAIIQNTTYESLLYLYWQDRLRVCCAIRLNVLASST